MCSAKESPKGPISIMPEWTLLYDLESPDVVARLFYGFTDFIAWHKDGRVEESEGVPEEVRSKCAQILKERGLI